MEERQILTGLKKTEMKPAFRRGVLERGGGGEVNRDGWRAELGLFRAVVAVVVAAAVVGVRGGCGGWRRCARCALSRTQICLQSGQLQSAVFGSFPHPSTLRLTPISHLSPSPILTILFFSPFLSISSKLPLSPLLNASQLITALILEFG